MYDSVSPMKYLKPLVLAGLLGLVVFFATNCSDEEGVCAGCDDPSAPWSKFGATSCYATKSDCEAAEGRGCDICN